MICSHQVLLDKISYLGLLSSVWFGSLTLRSRDFITLLLEGVTSRHLSCNEFKEWLYIVFFRYNRRTGTDRALLIWCSISLIIHGTFDSSLDENTPLVIGTNFLIYIRQPRTNRLFVSWLQLLGMPQMGLNYRISVNIGSCHVQGDAFPRGLLCVLYCEELFYDLVSVLHLQQLCVLVMFFFYVDINKLSSACVSHLSHFFIIDG